MIIIIFLRFLRNTTTVARRIIAKSSKKMRCTCVVQSASHFGFRYRVYGIIDFQINNVADGNLSKLFYFPKISFNACNTSSTSFSFALSPICPIRINFPPKHPKEPASRIL